MISKKHLLGILFWAILFFPGNRNWAQVNSKQESMVNVVVGKFYADEYSGKRLENDVPFLIDRALLNYKGLNMIEDERLGNIVVFSKDYTQKSFKDQYEGLGYIIFGDIASVKDQLTINSFLYDIHKDVTFDIKPVSGSNSDLFNMCSEIGRLAAGRIYEMENAISDQEITIAIISENTLTAKKNLEIDYLTDLLIKKAINNLDDYDNFKVLPYSESVKFNGFTPDEIKSYVRANGIIYVKIEENEDFVKALVPVFYLKKDKNKATFDEIIEMPTIPSNYYKVYDFMDFVINELLSFVNSVVTEDGRWNLEPLLFRSNDPKGYISEGDKYMATSQWFLSNYYYYMALDLLKEQDLRDSVFYRLGINKISEYRLAEAEEEFNKILVNNPDNPLGIKGLGAVSMARGDFNDAHKKFSFIAQQNPDDLEIYYLQGMTLYELGDYKAAIEALEKDRLQNPEDLKACHYLGLSYIQLKQYNNSIAEFRKLYEQDPNDKDNQYFLSYALAEKGITEYNNGNFEAAKEKFLESNKIYNLNYVANYLRLTLIRLGEYIAAEDLIETEIQKKNYERSDIYFQHALDIREIFLKELDPAAGEQVIKNLKRSLEYSDNPMAYYYLGNTYIYMGQIEEGLNYLMQAHQKDKSNLSIHLDLMEALLMNNRFEQCVELYKSLILVKTDYPVTERYLALMDYLMISALRLTGQDTRLYEKNLTKSLEAGTVIDGWSYDAYKAWLNSGAFREDDKLYLIELTKKMEQAGATGE
jgi:tetratricopeptide (TPR) repeat protein